MRIREYDHRAEIDGYHVVIMTLLARQRVGLCVFGFVRLAGQTIHAEAVMRHTDEEAGIRYRVNCRGTR